MINLIPIIQDQSGSFRARGRRDPKTPSKTVHARQGNPAPEKQLAGHVDDTSYWHDDSLHSSSHENSAWALRLLLRTLIGSGVMVNRRKLHRQAIRVREVNTVRPARPV